MDTNNRSKIDKIFSKIVRSNQIREAILFMENTTGDFSFYKGYGGRDMDSPLLMASITKLFTTSCILTLYGLDKISLADKITKYFEKSMLDGLHIYKGLEYSFGLTVSDLLFQITGLPDVYEEGENNFKDTVIQKDFSYSFEEIVEMTKHLKPHFKPQTLKRAYYADINFDILGIILEKIMNKPLSQIFQQFIFKPLELKNTYLPERENDFVPNIYNKHRVLHRPKFIMSSRASGGCVSTARDLMTFLKAFFAGILFNISIFDKLSSCNQLQASMRPICYGSGYMRLPLSGLTTLFMGKGELKGHSGSTGSFAFYYPIKDLFMVGDLNQMANPALPIRLAMQIAMCK